MSGGVYESRDWSRVDREPLCRSMNGTQHADTLPDGVPLPTGKFDHELHVKRMNRRGLKSG